MYLFILFLLVLIAIGTFYFFSNEQFGGKIEPSNIHQYAKSKHWKNGKFWNIEKTGMSFTLKGFIHFLKNQRADNDSIPKKNLDILPFDIEKFNKNDGHAKFVWYGHSVLLLKINNKNILIDPMFGEDCSPIGPVRTKRFSTNTLALIKQLPKIDAIVYTHDHYDHLDKASVDLLKEKVDTYFVALGMKRHLERWHIDGEQIKEFDWWQSFMYENIELTFTPTRHFSGRAISDRAKSLWGGWVFKTETEMIFLSGDGGYGKHFKEIGERFGPFDLAFVECGQYNQNWKQIHMHPEESVQAAVAVQAKKVVPIHWAAFKLAQHSWYEPVERFLDAAKNTKLEVCTPKIGQVVSLNDNKPNQKWFSEYK